jgi:hypothetical protein
VHPLAALALAWLGIRRVMGWDSGTSGGYLFQSGSGATLELAVWGTLVYLWRSSCSDRRWCLRHGRHAITDPQTGVTHKVCWRHAHLPSKYGTGRIKAIQAAHASLYLGNRPGRGLSYLHKTQPPDSAR